MSSEHFGHSVGNLREYLALRHFSAAEIALVRSMSGWEAGTEAIFHDMLPPNIGLIDPCLQNLSDCLLRTIQEIFACGHAAAVVLNSDSPTLPTALLVETAEILARPGERAVLGPSTDGGYYLLGLKTVHGRLFEDIAWGPEEVAAQTLERARVI